jgi:hypothetical protein
MHGRVSLVRVGWLTADLGTAIADDVRHAPTGTSLELLVPDDLADAAITTIREWLRRQVSPHVRIAVIRSTTAGRRAMGPSATAPCGDWPQQEAPADSNALAPDGHDAGTGVADVDPQQGQPNRRRSDQ